MTDVHNKKTRSYNMSQIKGRNTKPEIIVRKYLHHKGLRFRLHVNKLSGKPDLVLKKYNTAIFINGCFWHGHDNCKYFSLPKTRTEWWKEKIYNTKNRDKINLEKLTDQGWNTIVVWECELKPNNKNKTLNKLLEQITKNSNEK